MAKWGRCGCSDDRASSRRKTKKRPPYGGTASSPRASTILFASGAASKPDLKPRDRSGKARRVVREPGTQPSPARRGSLNFGREAAERPRWRKNSSCRFWQRLNNSRAREKSSGSQGTCLSIFQINGISTRVQDVVGSAQDCRSTPQPFRLAHLSRCSYQALWRRTFVHLF